MQRRQILGLCLLACLVLPHCGAPGPPLPPSLDLPQPVQDLKATRKGNDVHLSWTIPRQTTDDLNVRHFGVTRICVSSKPAMPECKDVVGEIDTAKLVQEYEAAAEKREAQKSGAQNGANQRPRQKRESNKPAAVPATAAVTIPAHLESDSAAAVLSFAVETLNRSGRSAGLSNQVQVPAIKTLPAPENVSGQVSAEGVTLSWTPVAAPPQHEGVSYLYRIYRREKGSAGTVSIGERPLGFETTFLDSSIGWDKNYLYHITAVSVLQHGGAVEGDNSSEAQIFTRDTFPPSVPVGLQAVFSGVGQKPFVDLTWAPDTEADLAGYNLYRKSQGETWVRLNSETIKIPSFRDGNVASGRKYTYSVTALDLHGNESQRSEEVNETVP